MPRRHQEPLSPRKAFSPKIKCSQIEEDEMGAEKPRHPFLKNVFMINQEKENMNLHSLAKDTQKSNVDDMLDFKNMSNGLSFPNSLPYLKSFYLLNNRFSCRNCN